MRWFCHCLGSAATNIAPVFKSVAPQLCQEDRLSTNVARDCKELRNLHIRELQANITAACTRISLIDCQTWFERISGSLGMLEVSMGIDASLVIFGPTGCCGAWHLSTSGPISTRGSIWMHVIQQHFLRKPGDALVVLQPACPGEAAGLPPVYSVVVQALPVTLAPSEHLALPIYSGSYLVAALLLSWGEQRGTPSTVMEVATVSPKGPSGSASQPPSAAGDITPVVAHGASSSPGIHGTAGAFVLDARLLQEASLPPQQPVRKLRSPQRSSAVTAPADHLPRVAHPGSHVGSDPPVFKEGLKLGPQEVVELTRLAQFLGYGIFADGAQANFLALVAEHMYCIHNSGSLHDLVNAVLQAVAALLHAKLQLSAQPLLAATTALVTPPQAAATPGTPIYGGGSAKASASSSSGIGGGDRSAVMFSWRESGEAMGISHTHPVATLSPRYGLDSTASQPFVFSSGGTIGAGHLSHLSGNGNSMSSTNCSGGGVGKVGLPLAAPSPHVDSGTQLRMCRVNSVASLRLMPGSAAGCEQRDSYGGGGSGLSGRNGGGAVGGAATVEASRIKAVRLQLPRTLLLKAIRAAAASNCDIAWRGGGVGSGGMGSTQRDSPASTLLPTATSSMSPTAAALHQPAAPSDWRTSPSTFKGIDTGSGGICVDPVRRVPLSTLVLSDASMHVLEDQSAYRDILLAGNLLGGLSPGSVVLCTEAFPTLTCAGGSSGGGGTMSSSCARPMDGNGTAHVNAVTTQMVPLPSHDLENSSHLHSQSSSKPATAAAASHGITFIPLPSSGGGGGGFRASKNTAAATAGVSLQLAPAFAAAPPVQLALYLVFSESLPAGVLSAVAAELQSIMALVCTAFRSALATSMAVAPVFGGGRIASDWQSLCEQLSGKCPAPTLASSAVANSGGPGAGVTNSSACAPLPRMPSASGLQMLSEVDGSSVLLSTGRLAAASAGGRPDAGTARTVDSVCNGAAASNAVGAGAGAGSGLESQVDRTLSNGKFPIRQPTALQRRLVAMAAPGLAVGSSVLGGNGSIGGSVALAAATPAPSAAVGADRAVLIHKESEFDMLRDGEPLDVGGAAAGGLVGVRTELQRSISSRLVHSSPQLVLEEVGPIIGAGSGPGCTVRPGSGLYAAPGLTGDTLLSSMRTRLSVALTAQDSSDMFKLSLSQDLAAIELHEVLGRGGQGVVFRGTLHGLETAIKVMVQRQKQGDKNKAKDKQQQEGAEGGGECGGKVDETDGEDGGGGSRELPDPMSRMMKRGAMEVVVASTLSHPNIVQVYASFTSVVVVRCHYRDNPLPTLRLCTADDPLLAENDPGPLNQVLCLEYCDAGTLLSVAREGAFRQACATNAANGAIWPALVPLYTSLMEVALALRHLHSRRLVHCDIKAANVLLKSSNRDPRGWSCKLSDFGCVRLMTEVGADDRLGFRMKQPLGTIGYMAPECFVRGMLLGPAVDIYAFGVLMWELLMCKMPYNNMNPQEVPKQVLKAHLRPVFHPLASGPYCALATRCWSSNPRRRPTAVELVSYLQQLLADAQAELRLLAPSQAPVQQQQQMPLQPPLQKSVLQHSPPQLQRGRSAAANATSATVIRSGKAPPVLLPSQLQLQSKPQLPSGLPRGPLVRELKAHFNVHDIHK